MNTKRIKCYSITRVSQLLKCKVRKNRAQLSGLWERAGFKNNDKMQREKNPWFWWLSFFVTPHIHEHFHEFANRLFFEREYRNQRITVSIFDSGKKYCKQFMNTNEFEYTNNGRAFKQTICVCTNNNNNTMTVWHSQKGNSNNNQKRTIPFFDDEQNAILLLANGIYY